MLPAFFRRGRLGQVFRYIANAWVGHVPFMALRMAYYRLFFKIGQHSTTMMGLKFRKMDGLEIGHTCNINPNCLLDTRGGKIVIGNFVDVAPEVNIWTLEHDFNDPDFKSSGAGVAIGDYAWIANRAIILPGVVIGEGAVVAAGAVVTKSVEPWTVVGGVPAKPIGSRDRNQHPRMPYQPFLL
ncbi:MAG TPA: acyltransferase [Catalimonadaceae bacterium]|jgi:acetyltransferase-like isoleucine patch superfamily enzyme|nr:acyltransferase [Catalimonadaceae bacterium]